MWNVYFQHLIFYYLFITFLMLVYSIFYSILVCLILPSAFSYLFDLNLDKCLRSYNKTFVYNFSIMYRNDQWQDVLCVGQPVYIVCIIFVYFSHPPRRDPFILILTSLAKTEPSQSCQITQWNSHQKRASFSRCYFGPNKFFARQIDKLSAILDLCRLHFFFIIVHFFNTHLFCPKLNKKK